MERGRGAREGEKEERKMGGQLPKAVWGAVNRVHPEITHPGRQEAPWRGLKMEGGGDGDWVTRERNSGGELSSPVCPLKTERPRLGPNEG